MTATALLPPTGVASLYPGGAVDWQLLWIQNAVLIFLQFTTGAALFTQDHRYAGYVTAPLEAAGWTGRHPLVLVHAATGVLLVSVNLVFAGRWLSTASFAAQPAMAATTLVLTTALAAMAVFGASLYANVRPDTRLPLWSFDYAFSRKLHRLLFVVVVATLGYHLYLTPRVSTVWKSWLLDLDPFGALALLSILVWGVLAAHSTVMLGEWATGRVFSRWHVGVGRISAVGGGIAALLVAGSVLEASAAQVLLVVATVLAAALFFRRIEMRGYGGKKW